MGQAHDHTQFSPVEFIPYAHDITASVKAFANAHLLECHPFYHDLPVWILHEPKRQCGRNRRIQIVAYMVSQQPYLSIVRAVDVFLTPTTMLVPTRCPAACFPTCDVVSNQQFNAQKFSELLAAAWQETATLEIPDEAMMEVAVASEV